MTDKNKKVETEEPSKVEEQSKAKDKAKKQKEEEMVTIPLKSMEEQLKEIDELKDKVNEYSDGWQRERADFDNYRKRILRDREQDKQNLTIEILKKYIDIHDDLNLALKNAPESRDGKQWAEGIALISQKMQRILDAEGIEVINDELNTFDPQFHEAISNEENDDFESGQIIEIIKKGYKIGNRVIRPALVRVAR